MKQASLEVEILGIRQNVEGEPSSIKNAVERVQREIDEITRRSPEINTLKAVIAVALSLADEAYSSKEMMKKEKIEKEICLQRLNELIKRIDKYLFSTPIGKGR